MTKKEIISSITPVLTLNSLAVAQKRYMKINAKGEVIETPAEMFYRVAEFMASADKKWDKNAAVGQTTQKFYEFMAKAEFYPAGRILFEAGNDHTGQMSSCFVLPISDSLEEIFNTLKAAAITQQNNGGTGFNFSKVRPKGDKVKDHPGVAAGPIHFLRTFDAALSRVLQGSKRHGGNMGILNVDHPDIEEFIRLKDNGSDIKNFNISVGVTRKFMEKLRNDEDYELINPRNKQPVKKLRAKAIFDQIIQRAWECADPGMIFLDAVQDANVNDHLGVMDATNPCGEQPLLPNESCNLGSIILANHVTDGQIDWDRLKNTVSTAVHYLDNLIELNKYPLPEIDEMVKKTRKIGLGVMGYAHLLYRLGIPYNSQKAVDLIGEIMKFVNTNAIEASKELAKIRGVFPAWKGSKWEKRGVEIRNSHVTSIQPTGTISMVANTSSGIEPVFSLVTMRRAFFEDKGNATGGSMMKVVDPMFEQIARENGFYSDELMEKIAQGATVSELEEIPAEFKKVFVTTHDVSYDWHVRIQAAAQANTDAAVSKTVNMTSDATLEDVRKAYLMAYQLGCKGVTIYRDGSKDAQVLNISGSHGHKAAEAKAASVVSASIQADAVISPFVPGLSNAEKIQSNEDVKVDLTPNALTVLEKRALKKDANGKVIESPEQLFRRVASFVAGAEKSYSVAPARVQEIENKFYNMLARLEFISGQALRNSETDLTLSACLVLPISDSIEGIMTAIAENTAAHKATCGTGINYSRLRPKGALVGQVGGVAAGPVAFMRALSVVQKTIQTKGGRGQGSMGILNVDHPDIESFIKAKDTDGELSNMNISVGATDAFMQALATGDEYEQFNPHDKEVVRKVKARRIFDEIVDHAWLTGDPGVIFVDRLERDNPTPTLGKLDATNTCGEQPLLPYETCNLGSIVMSKMLTVVADGYEVDWEKLRDTVYYSVRFLDNTLDVNKFPIEKVKQMSSSTRRIGLGIMGFADMLIMLGIPYNTNEAVEVGEKLMKFINEEAHRASEEIAKEKGSFAKFDVSVWPSRGVKYQRNSAVTTIAPTGYISIVADCSSGIEPIFALAFRRQASMGGHDQVEVNRVFEEIAKREGFYSQELMKKVAEHGSIQNLQEVPEHIRKIFVTAYDITPEWHVRIQAAFQKHTDNAVSKTINFPSAATRDDVAKVYRLAYDLGCKGVTIFRDGSKTEQALRTGLSDKKAEEGKANLVAQIPAQLTPPLAATGIVPRERPEVTNGSTYRIKTGYGMLYVTVNNDNEGRPFEVFATIGKTGGFFAAKSEAICRLISMSLRAGIDVQEIIEQLKGIRGPMPTWSNGSLVLSIPDAIAQILVEHVKKPQAKLDLKFAPSATTHDKKELSVVEEVKQIKATNKPEGGQPGQSQPQFGDSKSAAGASAGSAPDQSESIIDVAFTRAAPENVPTNSYTETTASHSKSTTATIVEGSKPGVHKTAGKGSIADIGLAPSCPECGSMLELGEGCLLCRGCGYSKCG